MIPNLSLLERVLGRVTVVPGAGCWLWTGKATKKGYGQIGFEGRNIYAHRAVLEALYGPLPPGVWALHRCDTKLCVRPSHLRPGSRAENVAEAVERGLMRGGPWPADSYRRGEGHHRARLTAAQVVAIRAARPSGGPRKGHPTHTELARHYGVSRGTIGDVLRRKGWTHL